MIGLGEKRDKRSRRNSLAAESYGRLSSFYNAVKPIAVMLQIYTHLLRSIKHEATRLIKYGFTLFDFTVAPYLLMSIYNLVESMLTADYATMFLIESDTMEEAKYQGGIFEGVIGKLAGCGSWGTNAFSARFIITDDGCGVKRMQRVVTSGNSWLENGTLMDSFNSVAPNDRLSERVQTL